MSSRFELCAEEITDFHVFGTVTSYDRPPKPTYNKPCFGGVGHLAQHGHVSRCFVSQQGKDLYRKSPFFEADSYFFCSGLLTRRL